MIDLTAEESDEIARKQSAMIANIQKIRPLPLSIRILPGNNTSSAGTSGSKYIAPPSRNSSIVGDAIR